ncbi:hypothetical protein M433DRAFT_152359 [Acidomyces richmondensis BFW]|nr:MAG: hypothetical protein FE78DRAFT_87324 [Acidomyces sp. 'richmondensis']KYG47360.1 hypothetical protein M433DRAFT_152359 [Acidomyces richmondensis BFW]
MNSAVQKVAIITGGASGMGYAVASALASTGNWELHLVDMNAKLGQEAAMQLRCSTFHDLDVTNYSRLAGVFKTAFLKHRRLDFVFANAGIVDSGSYYDFHGTGDDPPPEPSRLVVDVDLISVINTSYLAQHYFRQSPNDKEGPRSLIITASCGGFYACPVQPIYGAAKHGVIGWVRNIAGRAYRDDGVRVNAICPGTVHTNLLPKEAWKTFPEGYFTPLNKVVEVVIMLLDNKTDDSLPAGSQIEGHNQPAIGQTVEISGENHYFRTQYPFCDDTMGEVMGATEADEFTK